MTGECSCIPCEGTCDFCIQEIVSDAVAKERARCCRIVGWLCMSDKDSKIIVNRINQEDIIEGINLVSDDKKPS